MKVRKIYDRVVFFGSTVSEQKFIECFNEACEFLIAKFGEQYVVGENGSFSGAERISDNVDILEDYASALAEYVLVLLGDASKFELFNQKSNQAYLNVWRKCSKGKAVKPSLRGENHV